RRPPVRDRPRGARAARAAGRGRPDDARHRRPRAAELRVRRRRLLDEHARGARGARRLMATQLADGVRITDSALSQIVVLAAESVDGARVRRPKRRVEIDVEGGQARVELELVARYGSSLQEVGRDVQERVAAGLGTMCGLEPTVDVAVEELE